MNTDTLDPQAQRIAITLEGLRERRSPLYAKGLDSIITRLPDSPERDDLQQRRQQYLDSLEAQQ